MACAAACASCCDWTELMALDAVGTSPLAMACAVAEADACRLPAHFWPTAEDAQKADIHRHASPQSTLTNTTLGTTSSDFKHAEIHSETK